MRRSTQEITELVVFALIAILVGTLLLWGVGWVFTGLGWVFRLIAGFIWSLLRFIIPIAIVGGVIFLVVKLLAQPRANKPAAPSEAPASRPAPPIVPVSPVAPAPQPTVREPSAPPHAHAPGASAEPVVSVPPATPSEPIPSTDDVLADTATDARTDTATSTFAQGSATQASPDSPVIPEEARVNPTVDTSGFKEMDELAEELEAAQEDADDAQAKRDLNPDDPDAPRPS